MKRMRHLLFSTVCMFLVFISIEGYASSNRNENIVTKSSYIDSVEVMRVQRDNNTQSTTVKVLLNPSDESFGESIDKIELEDSAGTIYTFSQDEFYSTGFESFYLMELPFLLADGDIILTIFEKNGSAERSLIQDTMTGINRKSSVQSIITNSTTPKYWSGSTSQGEDVSFKVNKKTITEYSANIYVDGIYCNATVGYTLSSKWRIKGNKFRIFNESFDGNESLFKGKFINSKKAKGSFSYYDAYCDGYANVTWKATKNITGVSIPAAGKWSGNNIQFNVSSDGSELTTAGSSLENGASLRFVINFSGNCSGSITTSFTNDIPITNQNFERIGSDLTVKGIFSSSNSANGTYSFDDGFCTANGNWTASPN